MVENAKEKITKAATEAIAWSTSWNAWTLLCLNFLNVTGGAMPSGGGGGLPKF